MIKMGSKCYKIPKWLLYKAYFDKGYALSNYFKYLIAFFGLASRDVSTTLIIGFVYAVFCFILGWFWRKKGLWDAELEIVNQFNPFCKDVREKIG